MIKEHADLSSDALATSQALVLLDQKKTEAQLAHEVLLNSEEYKKREELKKKVARYRLIERQKEHEGESMKDMLLRTQHENLQKRQKVEEMTKSDPKLYKHYHPDPS